MKKYIYGSLLGLAAFALVGGAVAYANSGNGFGGWFGGGLDQKAELLGMTTEELQTALETTPMHELLDDNGITHQQLQERRQAEMLEHQAETLGMTVEELEVALETKTFAQLLDEQGISHTEMFEQHKAERIAEMTERLQALVDDGTITAEEMQERLEFMESREGMGIKGGKGMGGRGGMFGGGMGDCLSAGQIE